MATSISTVPVLWPSSLQGISLEMLTAAAALAVSVEGDLATTPDSSPNA